MTPEGNVLSDIKQYLSARGIFFFRCNTGRRGGVSFGIKGAPDIVGILPGGRFLAIEVKGPGGKASIDQLQFLGDIAKNGGVAFVAFSVDDVARHLESTTKDSV
jgi:hypothetical protein